MNHPRFKKKKKKAYSNKHVKYLYFNKVKMFLVQQSNDMCSSTHLCTSEALQVAERRCPKQSLPSCFMGTIANKKRLSCYAPAVKIKSNMYE